MNARLRWWKFNYQILRLFGIVPSKFIFNYRIKGEGSIPEARPLMLVPVHRTSVDIYAISDVTSKMISYVSTDTFGHSRGINALQKFVTKTLGSVVWEETAIANSRMRAVALARDVELRLDQRLIVAAFTQGQYQPFSVDSIEDGLPGLLQRYESRYLKRHGEQLRIPIVPVGLEYDYHDRGLEFSKTGERLARFIPYFPRWTVPAFGSRITVRFGEPEYFDDRSPQEVTASVMRKAAELSNIPFNVKSLPRR